MENKKQVGSSSSFSTDLFGSKESTPPSASTGIFASLFPPPTVVGRNYSCSEFMGYMQKQSSGNHVWSTKQRTAEMIIAKKNDGANNSIANKERNSIFQESVEHCPLSSSLYYGGQEDMYIVSSSPQTSSSYPIFKKDAVEDDPNGNNAQSASRGNWWEGSLYY